MNASEKAALHEEVLFCWHSGDEAVCTKAATDSEKQQQVHHIRHLTPTVALCARERLCMSSKRENTSTGTSSNSSF
jgi:hypothetical protein